MSLTPREIKDLRTLVSIAQKLLASVDRAATTPDNAAKTDKARGQRRIRRSGKELLQFRKMLKTERRRGVPVVELAKKHGISSAYIYQIG